MSSSLNRVFATWSPMQLCHVALLTPASADYVVLREQSLRDFGFEPVRHPVEVYSK